MLDHGGRMREASVRYGIALERWLDLSTGINPCGWPVPAVPATAWSRLPEDEDGLDEAAPSFPPARTLPVGSTSSRLRRTRPRLAARRTYGNAGCHGGIERGRPAIGRARAH